MFRAGGAAPVHRRRIERLAGSIAGGVLLMGAGVAVGTAAEAAPPPKNGKVTLCHATPPASAKNGWVMITVSTNAVTHAGHGDHADDIIPAFDYYVKSTAEHYPGKNLGTVFFGSTGAEILADGCHLPPKPTSSVPAPTHTHTHTHTAPPPPPPSTVTVTESTSQSESTSTSESSSSSVSESTAAAASTSAGVAAPVVTTSTATSADVNGSSDAGAEVLATASAAADGGAGGASPAAAHVGLAAGDTGDAAFGSDAGLIGAVVGGALAGLIGLAALATRRRSRWFGARS